MIWRVVLACWRFLSIFGHRRIASGIPEARRVDRSLGENERAADESNHNRRIGVRFRTSISISGQSSIAAAAALRESA